MRQTWLTPTHILVGISANKALSMASLLPSNIIINGLAAMAAGAK